jgi:hypothetical protein
MQKSEKVSLEPTCSFQNIKDDDVRDNNFPGRPAGVEHGLFCEVRLYVSNVCKQRAQKGICFCDVWRIYGAIMVGNIYDVMEKECMKNSGGETPLEKSIWIPIKGAVLIRFPCLLSLFPWIRSIRCKSRYTRKCIHPTHFEPEDGRRMYQQNFRNTGHIHTMLRTKGRKNVTAEEHYLLGYNANRRFRGTYRLYL